METVIILTALSAFISTNLDDLFILAAFFANPEFAVKEIILGQYLGYIFLLILSSMAYFLQFLIPSQWISLLGVIPIIIGIRDILHLKSGKYRGRGDFRKYKNGQRVIAVALVTIANGGDNLGVYMPLFASMNLMSLILTTIIFLILVGLWCLFGYKLVNNRILGDRIKDYGDHILPFVMIIVGLVIILKGLV